MSFSRRHALSLFAAGSTGWAGEIASASVGFRSDNTGVRSECGVGAMMPWADSLWAVTYNSHMKPTGTGLALYRIDENLKSERVHVHDGTHANRLIHNESRQCFIGPYAIDEKGSFRFIPEFAEHRLTSTFRHLKEPASLVYVLSMEGLLFELDVATLKPRQVANLVEQFKINKRPHFKGGFTSQGRVVVANNGFYEFGENEAGLFEYDGSQWKTLSRKPHMDVAARQNMGGVLFATGWDESSVLLWALVKGTWQRYRLPKGSHAFNQAWQTEWMRIREVETEHYLLDMHGLMYELQPIAFQDAIWGLKPICNHLRIIPDYCAFRGMLALGGNQTSPNQDNNAVVGQPQSNIWFGKTDDLWSWGKPQGWGGPWRNTSVKADQPSEPFLMTGFDRKVLHVKLANAGKITIEVDFLGNGSWEVYEQLDVNSYKFHAFPDGFSAHWVRLRPGVTTVASAEFMYT